MANPIAWLKRIAVIVASLFALPLFYSLKEQTFSIPREMVRVTVLNPERRPAILFHVNENQVNLALRLTGQTSETISLESGFYFLKPEELRDEKQDEPESTSVAVPAFAPALLGSREDNNLELTVRLGKRPGQLEGLCWIPGGPSLIGDTLGVGQPDEHPVKVVDVPGFWIGKHEVSNAEYAEFLNSTCKFDESWIDLKNSACKIRKVEEEYQADGFEKFPVVTVTYQGAFAYCDWLSHKQCRTVRLPTEIEWEKAARGPESFVYSYGNEYHPTAANQESGQATEVDEFQPNSWGAFGLTGNVFEWVLHQTSDSAEPVNPPTYTHVLRGGSFVLDGMYLRNSFRMRQSPTVMTDDIGFRIAVDEFSGVSK